MPDFVIQSASFASAKTIIHTLFSLIYPVDEFSFKDMSIMRDQPKISSCCICVLSKELGEYKIPNINSRKLLRRFSCSYRKLLDIVAFRILSNIDDGAPLRKYVERLQMIGLMMVILMVFHIYGELVFRGVGTI